jgi:DNA-binding SARP family transcriptional activator
MAGVAVEAVYQAVDLMPLLRVTGAKGTLRGFEMHDLACEVLCGLLVSRESCHTQALSQVVHELAGRREYDWMFDVLVASGDVDMMLEWIELLGLCMIEEARLDLLESVLDQVPAIVQAGSPRLLLIAALLHRSKGRTSQAFTLASAARRAAEVASDERGAIECLMVEIRLHWDVADYETILPRMGEALARAQGRGDNDTTAMLLGYMASAYAQLGDVKRGREYALKYREASRLPGVQSATKVQALQPVLFVLGFVAGDIALAASMLREARAEAKYPRALALQCDANLASLVLEMGRVTSAMRMISSVGVHLQASGFSILSDACSGTEGAIRAAMGDKPEAESLLRAAVEDALCPDDRLSVECNRLYRSAIRRATGSVDEALSDSEDAHAAFSDDGSGLPVMRCLAKIEMAANLLALGDLRRAEELASVAHRDASLWTAAYHLLRADMVLAEIERQQGAFDEAIARIAQHREYILTESANWQIAMYIRAFPGLLGVFAKAVGVDALPSHLLRMILHDYARPALDACHDELPTADMERLAARLLGKRAAAVFMRERASGPKAVVRLFGGMQVVTPTGAVTDKDWRKRKARLLFALLVLRRGQDMPREQIFEHFWPEMDEERAKSNFYVTWSIMKRALAAGTGGKGPCPYVEHVGGVCRVVPALISSDFAEFEDALTAMRKADRAGDASLALAAAERIVEQYRGELLPGELYDDWLGPIRDRCRHDYGDAMLRASQLTYEAGDSEKALHLVRAGLGQDPWREDLYQAALRYLIHTGQRSGAIETYVACKSKLAEDLGLDPSTETQRLYDQILAMEDPPGAPAPG